MKKLLAPLVLVGLIGCSDRTPQIIAVPQTQQAPVVQPGAMTVQGTATLDVSPDCADMTMTLTADGARPGIAASALAGKQKAVIEALKKLGLESSAMKISHVTLDPIYRHWPHELKVATYRAQITITATTKKFELVADMMETAAHGGASSVSTAFRRSDLPELKKKVREMALKAAREKAELTARTLGIDLGRVTTVAEIPAGHMWRSQYFPNYVANATNNAPAANTEALGGSSQTLSLDITISYELGKKA